MEKFISCDWGTSSFRLRLISIVTGKILHEIKTDEGIAEMYQRWLATGPPGTERVHFYKNKIAGSIRKLATDVQENLPVLISGMVSSSIGMQELPYNFFPFSWNIAEMPVHTIAADENFSHPLFLVSGFRTANDIMRGEETLLLGCDVKDDAESIFIFPGTHSKHVLVKNKMGVDFKTYMTGEIFALLAKKSILHSAVDKGGDGRPSAAVVTGEADTAANEKSFAEGLTAGMEDHLLHATFTVRTRQLLQKENPESNYNYLSGLLVGAELSAIRKKNCPVYLVSSGTLQQQYLKGLQLSGLKNKMYCLDADQAFINGHCKIARYLFTK